MLDIVFVPDCFRRSAAMDFLSGDLGLAPQALCYRCSAANGNCVANGNNGGKR